jgi:hypothetical protein
MGFFFDLITNGLLVGLMYSLVALGFVLISKRRASSILPRAIWSCLLATLRRCC